MAKRIYLDSNVFIDYFRCGSDGLRPLSEFAFSILKRTFSCEFEIIISGWVVHEVKKKAKLREFEELVSQLKKLDKVSKVEVSSEDSRKALELSKETGVHLGDSLHYILAVKGQADILVSNDRQLQNLPEAEILIRDYQTIDL